MEERTKQCTKCLEIKNWETEFYISIRYGRKSQPRKADAVCKLCSKAIKHEHYTKNKERAKLRTEAYSKTPAGQFTVLKSSAKDRGIEVGITFEEFVSIRQVNCSYCGKEVGNTGSAIDRVDSSKGYVHGNLVTCCKVCNGIKMGHSIDFLKSHLEKMLEGLKKVC